MQVCVFVLLCLAFIVLVVNLVVTPVDPHALTFRAPQVDATGKAWVVGYTYSALEGRHRPSRADIFVMTFDGDENHLWTRQRGGSDYDWAEALYVTGRARWFGVPRCALGRARTERSRRMWTQEVE